MAYTVFRQSQLEWIPRDDESGRTLAGLSDSMTQSRANIWRYDPGAKGRRHRHKAQEETFIVLSGTLSMYLGEPPERVEVPAGDVIHIQPGTALQSVNHGDEDLVVFVYGTPPESEQAELLDSAV